MSDDQSTLSTLLAEVRAQLLHERRCAAWAALHSANAHAVAEWLRKARPVLARAVLERQSLDALVQGVVPDVGACAGGASSVSGLPLAEQQQPQQQQSPHQPTDDQLAILRDRLVAATGCGALFTAARPT